MTHPHSLQTRRRVLFTGATFLVLSGCGNLIGPENPPGRIYVLTPRLPVPQAMPALPWQLSVAKPQASASLATDRIALIRDETLDYYADAEWTDTVPQLVQNILVQALEQSGALRSVGRDIEGIRADYILQSEIESFEARYTQDNGPPTAVVDIIVKLIAARSGTIAAARGFHHEQNATANSVPAVVTAFDAAASAALTDIVNWVMQTAPALDAAASAKNG